MASEKQQLAEPLLARPLVEQLSLSTREMLAAAADQFPGSVYVTMLLNALDEQRLGRAFGILDGVFHAEGGLADSGPEHDHAGWSHIGDKKTGEWTNGLTAGMLEAEEKGLSQAGKEKREILTRKHR